MIESLTAFLATLAGKGAVAAVSVAATTGGLAATGTLPEPVQQVASEIAAAVGVELPSSDEGGAEDELLAASEDGDDADERDDAEAEEAAERQAERAERAAQQAEEAAERQAERAAQQGEEAEHQAEEADD